MGSDLVWRESFFVATSTGTEPLADDRLDSLANRLAALPEVIAAYVKPPAFVAS